MELQVFAMIEPRHEDCHPDRAMKSQGFALFAHSPNGVIPSAEREKRARCAVFEVFRRQEPGGRKANAAENAVGSNEKGKARRGIFARRAIFFIRLLCVQNCAGAQRSLVGLRPLSG